MKQKPIRDFGAEASPSSDDWQDLRQQLCSPPDPADEWLCQSIMGAVGNTATRRRPAASLIGFRTLVAAGAAAAVIAMLVISWVSVSPEVDVPVAAVPAAEDDPHQALAHAVTQQVLLRRDVEKLAEHLRQNVILFQPATTQ